MHYLVDHTTAACHPSRDQTSLKVDTIKDKCIGLSPMLKVKKQKKTMQPIFRLTVYITLEKKT